MNQTTEKKLTRKQIDIDRAVVDLESLDRLTEAKGVQNIEVARMFNDAIELLYVISNQYVRKHADLVCVEHEQFDCLRVLVELINNSTVPARESSQSEVETIFRRFDTLIGGAS